MSVTLKKNEIELSYSKYQKRQYEHIEADTLIKDLDKAKISNKFLYDYNEWQKIAYPGYAVVSLLKNNPGNEKLIQKLFVYQHELVEENNFQDLIFKLPKDSFHQTIANTLSSDRFMRNIRLAGLEKEYPTLVKAAFNQVTNPDLIQPIQMKIVGLSVFGASLGVLGVFENPNDYERILLFREDFYANEKMAELDVKYTRPFIGHITLGYFGRAIVKKDRLDLFNAITALNEKIQKDNLVFQISNAELCNYDELSCFNSAPNFPSFQFYKK